MMKVSDLSDPLSACEAARDYLQNNIQLRKTLGLAFDAQLEPWELGEGEHNKNFMFCDPASARKFVLRINVVPQPFHSNQVAYEYAALQALEPSGCTPAPLFLDDSSGWFEHGAMIIDFCEGHELDFDRLGPCDVRHAIELMANVHSVPVLNDCPVHRPRDPLRELYDECIDRIVYYRASGFEDARITSWADRFIAAVENTLEAPCRPSDCTHIINTETLPSHFLLSIEGASGENECAQPGFFIDWERPIIGEVAQDLAFFVAPTTTFWDSNYLFPREQIEEVLEQYWKSVDGRFERGNFDARFRAYLAVSVLRAVAWCCRAYARLGLEPHLHMTQKAREKIDIYLSDDFLERIYRDIFQ